jgi:hypothetical protein
MKLQLTPLSILFLVEARDEYGPELATGGRSQEPCRNDMLFCELKFVSWSFKILIAACQVNGVVTDSCVESLEGSRVTGRRQKRLTDKKRLIEEESSDYSVRWDSSVGLATACSLGGPGIKSRWVRNFPHPSRPALGPTRPSCIMDVGCEAAGAWR